MPLEPGIFAKTFPRSSLAANLDAVIQHDLHCIQFNLACTGLPSMPDSIEPQVVANIRREVQARGITLAAVSGTFNMAHPDPQVREAGLYRLAVLAEICNDIGTNIITLCTGTRDLADMWRWHAENSSPEAWQDMLETDAANPV
ncbi:MAG TPA: TIM barrel protein [Chloroflexia bacterium]|nr:TIM barrel protein [Chloroflexia bacterium]